MSKIKNGGLDQYGAEAFKQQQFGTAGVEGVKKESCRRCLVAFVIYCFITTVLVGFYTCIRSNICTLSYSHNSIYWCKLSGKATETFEGLNPLPGASERLQHWRAELFTKVGLGSLK